MRVASGENRRSGRAQEAHVVTACLAGREQEIEIRAEHRRHAAFRQMVQCIEDFGIGRFRFESGRNARPAPEHRITFEYAHRRHDRLVKRRELCGGAGIESLFVNHVHEGIDPGVAGFERIGKRSDVRDDAKPLFVRHADDGGGECIGQPRSTVGDAVNRHLDDVGMRRRKLVDHLAHVGVGCERTHGMTAHIPADPPRRDLFDDRQRMSSDCRQHRS